MDVDNKYGVKEIQIELLKLLAKFHKFCLENDIHYSLDWGSLLGAVRHKGFIPWDDDLDVMLDRDNYNKLICMLSSNGEMTIDRGTKRTQWVDCIFLNNYVSQNGFVPVLDLFVIDNAPDGAISRKFRVLLIKLLQGMMKKRLILNKGCFFIKMCLLLSYLVGKLFPYSFLYKMYNSISSRSDGKMTKKTTCYNCQYSSLNILYDAQIMKEIIISPFENIEAPIIKDYDDVLTKRYGDYMTPPPDSDRIPKHMGQVV